MTFGARNGKFCQRTNCQDSKLASKFSPSCNYVVANFWISDNFGGEAFLGLDIRCTLLERFELKGDEISRCREHVSYSWTFHSMKESFMFDVAKYLRKVKRTSTRFSFSFCTTWLFICADIWTFWRAEKLRIYQWRFKTKKASQLKVET